MADYKHGPKREVAEIKFLIHDLRVGRFINEVVHFHVTLNTDLEIYGIDQAQILHSEDLTELKEKAGSLRKSFRDYCNAVQSGSPERAILLTANEYLRALLNVCELILNPRWGRIDKVLSFLPKESRSVRSRSHYKNSVRWIWGVRSRIEHFFDEQEHRNVIEQFDIAADIQEFTRDVIYGYVAEKGSARVEITLDRLDSAVLSGNRQRFRRMFFNLVMNAVDAMSHRKVGALNITAAVEGDRVVLRVGDNGCGITPEKISELLKDKETLDGELHSLGFVFVRQTVSDFKGDLTIESELDRGTTVIVSLPFLPDGKPSRLQPSRHDVDPFLDETTVPRKESSETPTPDAPRLPFKEEMMPKTAVPKPDEEGGWGETVYFDYTSSEAQFPGAIFAMGVTAEDEVDFFAHQPYERYWNITHEDLSPMFFEATVRGRLEEDDHKEPLLILKAPQNSGEYFEFRNIPTRERKPDRFIEMVHDEYIRIARKLVATGLTSEMGVLVTGARKFFPSISDMSDSEPFSLKLLAGQPLSSEER
jgi:hypothetical protein